MENAASPQTTPNAANSNCVIVRGVVVAYTPNAMEDSFGDGDFQSFDGTRLRIVEPTDMAGRELTIFHDGEVGAESLWRAVNQAIEFEVPREDLDPSIILFAGAVTGLRRDIK